MMHFYGVKKTSTRELIEVQTIKKHLNFQIINALACADILLLVEVQVREGL